jgi:Tfp pilus assembly protein PilF
MARHDFTGAIATLRFVLANEPNHARAHAMLSVCLLRTRRRFAAEHEARMALALEPESLDAQIAHGWVALARHALGDAERAFRAALALSPECTTALEGLGSVAAARGDLAQARAHFERALAIDPQEVSVIVALADAHAARGESALAEARLCEALAIEPERPDALAARGALFLRSGRKADALEHALWALRTDATSRRALVLLADIKARGNVFLGLWWRFNTWLVGMEAPRRVFILVAMYAAYRAATITAAQLGAAHLATSIGAVWLAFIVYTWVAAPIFRRAIDRELAGVRLRYDF